MPELNPRDLIDRNAEQELFRNLVTFTSTARMLVICDKGGRGKSSLLRRLQYNCRWEIRPPVPSCRVELDRQTDPDPFVFVERIVNELGISKRFARFSQLNTKRKLKDLSLFSQEERVRDARFSNLQATASVQEIVGESSIVAGVYAEKATFQIPQLPEFTTEQEQLAKQKCVEAFFEDLRAIAASHPLVLILDAWERCNLSLRDWIFTELLGNHCFTHDMNLRPDKLAIVIAGRPHNPADSPYGLHPDEFYGLFDDEPAHDRVVKSRKSLSEWENDHVRTFLENNGYSAPTEMEVGVIQGKLKQGCSFEQIENILDALKATKTVLGIHSG